VSEAGRDRPLWPNTPGGRERSSEGSRSRACRSEQRWSPGKPGGIDDLAEAGAPPSSQALPDVTSFAIAPAGRAAVEATIRGESRRWGDSGIERFRGCSYFDVGCRS